MLYHYAFGRAGGTGGENDIGGILEAERLDAFRIRGISLLALSQSESDVWVVE